MPNINSSPDRLSRTDVLRGLRMSVWEGSFSTVWATLTGGAFLTGFALYLHAGSFAIGLLTAIPTFAGLVQVISSYSGEKRSTRKPLVSISSLVGRLLFLPILLLPVLLRRGAVYPFLILFAGSYVLLNVAVPAWTSWMSDLVPPDYRGRYFARRNMIAGIVGMSASLPAAWFLDYATRQHAWANLGFGVLFGVAVACSVAGYLFIRRQPEPPKPPAPDAMAKASIGQILNYLRAPFADPNFRRLMTFNTLFSSGQFFAAPFFTVYALQVLGLNYVWLQIFAAITSISSLASMPLWGYLADKFGNKPLLAIGVWGVFTLPITWMFTTPNHVIATMLILVELNLVGGMFWAVVGLTQFNLLIGSSPAGKTSIYVATMASVTGLAGGVAPLLGGATMRALQNWHAHALGMSLQNYHITFLIAALLRVAALPFLRSIVDARSAEAREVLRQLGRAKVRSWRNIRKLQSGGQQARLKATEALGDSRTQLAGNELRAALMDPSQEVREEAAHALGEIGDSSAVDALLVALHDPAAGLIEEAARALARIGDRKANAPLASLLRSEPERLSRRSRIVIAQSLGQLGGSDAVTTLLQALAAADDEELAEAVVEALGKTGSSRAAPALIALLERTDISFVLRRLLVRALGEIGDAQAIAPLRRELSRYVANDAMAPALADALARLDDGESALQLHQALNQVDSPVARRQIAHAVGRLLGQGELVYSLLSKDDMARDAALTRLLQEALRCAGGGPAEKVMRVAIKAHSNGDGRGTMRALNHLAKALGRLHQAEDARAARCRMFLEGAAERRTDTEHEETMLLAFAALNGLRFAG